MLKHPVNHVIEAARHLVCCINKFSATFTIRISKPAVRRGFLLVEYYIIGKKEKRMTNNLMTQMEGIIGLEIVLGVIITVLFIAMCLSVISIKSSINEFVDLYYKANKDKIKNNQENNQ